MFNIITADQKDNCKRRIKCLSLIIISEALEILFKSEILYWIFQFLLINVADVVYLHALFRGLGVAVLKLRA